LKLTTLQENINGMHCHIMPERWCTYVLGGIRH
jgi:hypothetical protein